MNNPLPAPLVPAYVDLRDFPYMPVEFGRLFASETWVLSSDAEKVAAITLWGRSWAEEPAGSLPNDERMLAHLSGAGKAWKKVRDMALRGWVAAADGRLYHAFVCEKALEAWLEKLTQRLSSGAGNAKRWGTEFDPSSLEVEIHEARAFLTALNPQSRVLSKRKPPGVPSGIGTESRRDRISIPSGIPSGSQGKGREGKGYTDTGDLTRDPPAAAVSAEPATDLVGQLEGHPDPKSPTPNPAAALAIALRRVGFQCTPMNPDLVAFAADGGTQAELTALAELDEYRGKPAVYLIRAARRMRAEGAKPITGATHGTPEPRESLVDRNARRAAEILERNGAS